MHQVRAGTRGGHTLVFFPPAGSSASSGWPVAAAVAADWAVWSVQYPARGPRLGEPPAGSIREQALACLAPVLAASERPLLFGHSFGAYLAYDVAQLLERQGVGVTGLLVSGISAPGTLTDIAEDRLSDESLMKMMFQQSGTPNELLANEELMAMVLPAMRADLALGRSYVDDHGRRLAAPLLAMGGRTDTMTAPERLRTWHAVTDRFLGVEIVEGDHFYYLDDPAMVANLLEAHWPARERMVQS